MASRKRPDSTNTRINTRLENFLAQKLGAENVEFYEQESCIEENKKKIFFGKFSFRSLIICDDRFYIADNPPKNLDNYIFFEDVTDIKTIDDIPKFLTGVEKENSLHIRITYFNNPKRKQELEKIKNKIIELKKNIIFSKSIDSKLLETEMNTPRAVHSSRASGRDLENDLVTVSTFREWSNFLTNNESLKLDLDLTNRSDMLTNRTNKSVRFDQDSKNEPEIDPLTDKAVNQRYKNLIEKVNKLKMLNGSMRNSQDLSLSLPLTPRSIDGNSLPEYSKYSEYAEISFVSKETSKSLQNLSDKINKDFIQDCDKSEATLDIYVLNPKTRIFQTLKSALFRAKIKSTINYHNTAEENKLKYEKRFEKKIKLDKNFKQFKAQIFLNLDNLTKLSSLYDELLKTTFDYNYFKKLFWNESDFYKFTVKQLDRYLPFSETNMKLGKASASRRVKELDCAIVFIETLIVMFEDTEFNLNRNDILYEEKCKYLDMLIKILICNPEIAELIDKSFDDEIYELKNQMKNQLMDLSLISSVLLWEIIYFMSLNSWNSLDLNLEIFIRKIETCDNLEIFMSGVVTELSKMLNSADDILLSQKETVIVFKIMSLFYALIEKSNTNKIKKMFKEKFYEEFKYYFNEDRIRLKTFNYYPIFDDLMTNVRKLQRHIL